MSNNDKISLLVECYDQYCGNFHQVFSTNERFSSKAFFLSFSA
jgi:hypothetical protein